MSSMRSRRLAVVALLSLAALSACSTAERSAPAAVPPEPVPLPSAPVTPPLTEAPSGRPKIVAFGDSLTAGFGIEKNQAYPAVLQRLLDERGYQYEVVNAGVSGETSAGGLRRIDHVLEDGDIAVVIVELGGNDGLRGLPPKDLEKNLAGIVEKSKARGAKVLLTGMEAPPNLGADYTAEFRAVFPALGQREKVTVLPFFLEGVAGDPDLNQLDGIHPNQKGAEIVAGHVLGALESLLEK